jgi:hypothetical protein
MKVQMYLIGRDGSYNATAIYEDGTVTVCRGSKIRQSFASHVRGGKTAKKFRESVDVVGEDGLTKQDCVFTSPSTAAQFVMGSSVNGWTAWHIDKKTNLKSYVEAHGGAKNGKVD